MYKLYLDKNKTFEANIQLEGVDLEETFARLIVETDGWDLKFDADIDRKGNVKIPIRKLKNIYSENTEGTLRLEVIADDTYFEPWQDSFQLLRSKSVTVTEVKTEDDEDNQIKEASAQVTVKEQNDEEDSTTDDKKKKANGKKIDNKLLKDYIKDVIYAVSESDRSYKEDIKRVTERFVKKNNLKSSSKKRLYSIIKESREVIVNAVRRIR